MPNQIEHNGEIYEIPDEATPEMISQFFNPAQKTSKNAAPELPETYRKRTPEEELFAKSIGANRTPISNIRDVLGGMAEGGKNIAEMFTGIKSPEMAHLESENPNPLLFGAGQYLPAIAAGGASIPGQAIAAGIYGTSQHKPGEETLFGTLPEGAKGRALGGLEDLMLTLGLGTAGKYGPKAISKSVQYMSPNKEAAKLVESLSGGKTAEQNISELSQKIQQSRAEKEAEALQPKHEILSEAGKNRIIPSQKNPQPVINKTESIFAEHPKDITPEKTAALKKALKTYYEGNEKELIEPGDLEHLIESGEHIYNHPGINETGISNLETILEMEKPVKGKYLSIKEPNIYSGRKIYGPAIEEAHQAYIKKPTFENADELQSRLYKKQDRLYNKIINKTDTGDDYEIYQQLKNNRKAVLQDINNFIETLPEASKEKYSNFRNLWRDQVAIYDRPGAKSKAIRQMAQGEDVSITPANISSAFNFPNKKVKEIIKHIGDPAKKNIIFNELLKSDPESAREIANAIIAYREKGGGEHYVSPELLKKAKSLKTRANIRDIMGPLVGTIAGAPFGPLGSAAGGAIGAGVTSGKDVLRVLGELLAKRK